MKITPKRFQSIADKGSVWSGVLVVLGLVVEIWYAYTYRKNGTWLEVWLPTVSAALVAVGVFFEVLFTHISKHFSDRELAELNKVAAEARERAALLEQLTAYRHVPKYTTGLVSSLTELNLRTPIRAQINYQTSDVEALCYAAEIAAIFRSANIEIAHFSSNHHIGTMVLGLHMAGTEELDLNSIQNAFMSAGIEFGHRTGVTHTAAVDGSNLILFVGPKTPPNLEELLQNLPQ